MDMDNKETIEGLRRKLDASRKKNLALKKLTIQNLLPSASSFSSSPSSSSTLFQNYNKVSTETELDIKYSSKINDLINKRDDLKRAILERSNNKIDSNKFLKSNSNSNINLLEDSNSQSYILPSNDLSHNGYFSNNTGDNFLDFSSKQLLNYFTKVYPNNKDFQESNIETLEREKVIKDELVKISDLKPLSTAMSIEVRKNYLELEKIKSITFSTDQSDDSLINRKIKLTEDRLEIENMLNKSANETKNKEKFVPILPLWKHRRGITPISEISQDRIMKSKRLWRIISWAILSLIIYPGKNLRANKLQKIESEKKNFEKNFELLSNSLSDWTMGKFYNTYKSLVTDQELNFSNINQTNKSKFDFFKKKEINRNQLTALKV